MSDWFTLKDIVWVGVIFGGVFLFLIARQLEQIVLLLRSLDAKRTSDYGHAFHGIHDIIKKWDDDRKIQLYGK
jgi:hypothetical protein